MQRLRGELPTDAPQTPAVPAGQQHAPCSRGPGLKQPLPRGLVPPKALPATGRWTGRGRRGCEPLTTLPTSGAPLEAVGDMGVLAPSCQLTSEATSVSPLPASLGGRLKRVLTFHPRPGDA